MDLNIFRKISDSIKRAENREFLVELKNSIDKNEVPILDKIENENKLSIGTKNKIENEFDNILLEYSKETEEKGPLVYIVEKKDNECIAYEYENGTDSVIRINENNLPLNASVNSALRKENEKYLLDEEASLEIKNRITDMAKDLIEKQNEELEEYRKEGHLYRVSERINDSVFLWDITDKSNFEIEEVDFPEELLDKAIEGTVFEYIDEKYRLKWYVIIILKELRGILDKWID